MKQILYTLTLITCLVLAGQSPALDTLSVTDADRVEDILLRLTYELNLTTGQRKKLKPLLSARSLELLDVRGLNLSNGKKKDKFREINKIYRQRFKKILNTEQRELYLSLRNELIEQRKIHGVKRKKLNDLSEDF